MEVSKPGPVVATTDGIAAYQIAKQALPRAELWQRAVSGRADSEDADLVFGVVDALRSELQSRIGDLAYGGALVDSTLDALPLDRLEVARATRVALELVLNHFPDDEILGIALACRRDGSDVLGVRRALDAWRSELRMLLGDAVHAEAIAIKAGQEAGFHDGGQCDTLVAV
jgi:hypothetical protein